jgi:hypothetical protein
MSNTNLAVVPDARAAERVESMNIEGLLMKALDSGVSIDTMERLMAMRRELVEEQARAAFFTALAGFQSECPVIPKTEAVANRGGQGVRYKFAPLDVIVSTVRPHLQKYGLSYTINAVFDLENKHLIAVVTVHHTAGHSEASEFRVPISSDNFMNGAQHFGSASSYAKRYALCNALGLLTGDEDDDAHGTSAARPASATRPQGPRQEAPVAQPTSPGAAQAESERRAFLRKRVAGLCVELGYDDEKHAKALARLDGMADEQIERSAIPSLEKLLARKLADVVRDGFAERGYDEAGMNAYIGEHFEERGLEGLTLDELRGVAKEMEAVF